MNAPLLTFPKRASIVTTSEMKPTSNHPWDGFLAGPENELAHASVLSLARGEGTGISPLVVHGMAGVGKSRLLSGLVGEWLTRQPGSSVSHIEAEGFAAACAEAAGHRGTTGWSELRARFRSLDLLVIEDIHHLERAPLALEELTHTVDALENLGSAVAVSARVGPGQWENWPSRLVNRFLGGLAVRIDPPGLNTRRRFVLERARERGLKLTADAVDSLAESSDGYRTLEGSLAKLALSGRVERKPLDRTLVNELLEGEAGPAPGTVSIELIAKAVAARFGVSVKDLRSASRRAAFAAPRHLAMRLARGRTGLSYQAIGAYFGGRDPATVRHAIEAANARIEADPGLAAAVESLRKTLGA